MGLVVVIIGIFVLIFASVFWGLVLIVIGLILMFMPGVPYGYSNWRDRRRSPP